MGAVNPSKTYVKALHLQSDNRTYHMITVHGYRQVVSLNAFFHGLKKMERDRKRGVIWFEHNEYEHERIYSKPDILSLVEWPADDDYVQHESMWAFYEYIGYDYKQKRWVDKPNLTITLHVQATDEDGDEVF
jgi:hypothetical protein